MGHQHEDEIAHSLVNRSRRCLTWWATLLVVCVGVAACTSFGPSDSPTTEIGSHRSITASAEQGDSSWPVFATVPAGQPGLLVPDPDGQAIWWWSPAPNGQAQVYRFDTVRHAITTWNLGDAQTLGLEVGEQYGLAVETNGTVWVGANLKLVELDTTTGLVRVIDVKKPGEASHPAPPQLANFSAISALAADASGNVAVVTSDTTSIPIYHSSTQSFSYLKLPQGMNADDASYLPDGALGVAVGDNDGQGGVLIVTADGGEHYARIGSPSFLVSAGKRFLAGSPPLFWVYPKGNATRGSGSEASTQWIAYPSTRPTWPLADGDIVSLTHGYDGFQLLSPNGPARQITLPRRPCGTGPSLSGGGPIIPAESTTRPKPTTTTTPVCYTVVGAMTAIGNTAWYLEDYDNLTYVWHVPLT